MNNRNSGPESGQDTPINPGQYQEKYLPLLLLNIFPTIILYWLDSKDYLRFCSRLYFPQKKNILFSS